MPWSPSSRWSLILKVNSEGAASETVCPRLVASSAPIRLRMPPRERTRLRVLIEVPPLICRRTSGWNRYCIKNFRIREDFNFRPTSSVDQTVDDCLRIIRLWKDSIVRFNLKWYTVCFKPFHRVRRIPVVERSAQLFATSRIVFNKFLWIIAGMGHITIDLRPRFSLYLTLDGLFRGYTLGHQGRLLRRRWQRRNQQRLLRR